MGLEVTNLNIINAMYEKPTANLILNGDKLSEKLSTFPLRSGTRQECPLSLLLFNIVPEVLAIAIIKIEIRINHIGKEEIKLSLFTDNIILYIENPIDSTPKKKKTNKQTNKNKTKQNKTLLEVINEFSKVTGYKINT